MLATENTNFVVPNSGTILVCVVVLVLLVVFVVWAVRARGGRPGGR